MTSVRARCALTISRQMWEKFLAGDYNTAKILAQGSAAAAALATAVGLTAAGVALPSAVALTAACVALTAALQYYCHPHCSLVLQIDRAGTWRAAEASDDRALDVNAADALYILGAVQV